MPARDGSVASSSYVAQCSAQIDILAQKIIKEKRSLATYARRLDAEINGPAGF